MPIPFSNARNCSNFSARSRAQTGICTSRTRQGLAAESENPQVLQKWKSRQLLVNGIVRREKYKAWPAWVTTTFTTFGLSYSLGSSKGVAAVDISLAASAPITASMTLGSMSAVSPRLRPPSHNMAGQSVHRLSFRTVQNGDGSEVPIDEQRDFGNVPVND
jgi:hypothetical protein